VLLSGTSGATAPSAAIGIRNALTNQGWKSSPIHDIIIGSCGPD
jgi:hypothetical protein